MELLEQKAKEKGYHKLILESREPLVSAMILYGKIGYHVIQMDCQPQIGQKL